ncbi:unnamed protein product [Cylicostephanus goldi]|uniref:Uncharacterized protein n=1 Tax=Cylicostephanus goldi TaxID=71465 RepID=A0A3P7PIG0_CYLGO|nr:unnamed protein product [Cylicostephanus goldi]
MPFLVRGRIDDRAANSVLAPPSAKVSSSASRSKAVKSRRRRRPTDFRRQLTKWSIEVEVEEWEPEKIEYGGGNLSKDEKMKKYLGTTDEKTEFK